MICVRGPFIGAWEHPTMPLTKREAEIRNKPLGEAATPAVWNEIHNKIDQNVAPTPFGRAVFLFDGSSTEYMPLSKRMVTFGNGSSEWEAVFP